MAGKFRLLGGGQRIATKARRLVRATGQVMFPHFCLDCGREGRLLCKQCEMQYALQKGILFSLRGEVPCFAAARYADPILRNLLQLYKYERVREAGEILTGIFVRVAAGQVADVLPPDDEPVVVPVPMHRLNWALRGFNQVERLATAIAADFELELDKKSLNKKYSWRTQASIDQPEKRRANSAGRFAVSSEKLAGRSVLLIDDVITTGATALDCVRALRSVGVREVRVLSALKGSGSRL